MAAPVVMPQLGEGVLEGLVVRWLKQCGEAVTRGEALVEIETDKVTMEIPAEADGMLLEVFAEAGEMIPVKTIIGYVGRPGEVLPSQGKRGSAETAAPETAPAVPAAALPRPQKAAQVSAAPPGWASPVARRVAKTHNVNLTQVTGTGRQGAITKRDVLAYVDQSQEKTALLAAQAPGDRIITPSPMRAAIARHMTQSVREIPHVTTVFEMDFENVHRHREQNKQAFADGGVKLTYMVYIVMAAAQALRQHPLVNSHWQDGLIYQHQAVNIGMATAVESGLVVPVILNADQLNLRGLAAQIGDLADRARNKRLPREATLNSTFTVTNHGATGSITATPIIHYPQCAILGVGKLERRVKVVDEGLLIRLMAYISLTFDHRILDGAAADAFLNTFKTAIENWPPHSSD